MELKKFYILLVCLMFSFLNIWANDGQLLLEKGVNYVKSDNFPMAMKCFTKSMEIAERDKDWHTVIKSNGYIGNVYFNINDYTRSIQYLLKGYSMCDKYGEQGMKVNFLTNIVSTYAKLGNVNKAWEYFRLLEKQKSNENPKSLKYYIFYDRARIAFAENKPQEALIYHKKALKWAQDEKMDLCYTLFQYCEIGQIYLHIGKIDEALKYGEKCLKEGGQECSLDLLTSVYQLMANGYHIQGDYQQEQHFRNLYLSLSDSVFNRKDIFSADNELVEYENRVTNEHISSLNGVINKQAFTLIIGLILLILLTVLSILLWRNNRKLKVAHRALIDKNRELQKQEQNTQQLLQQLVDQQSDNKEEIAETESTDLSGTIGPNKEQVKILFNKIVRVFNDIDYISRPEFNLNMLAEAVGSNTKYVSQVINEMYGKNFKTILNERRISEASKRLADQQHYKNRTIQAIYEEVGYTNAVSFIRSFRKINGMTPSEYIRMSTGEDDNSSE